MKDVRVLKETFERPAGFDAAEHFRTAFGIVAGLDVTEISLLFDKTIAGLIKERRWHPTQKLEDLVDGDLRMTMTCSQSPELFTWLLGWGEHVMVERPQKLAKRIAERHRLALEKQKK